HSTCLSTEDCHHRSTLLLVSPFIDEEPQFQFRGFVRPKIPFEAAEQNHVQTVKPDIAVAALTDVIREHALTECVGWRLCELAGARDVAPAHVEPVSRNSPLGYGAARCRHRQSSLPYPYSLLFRR